MRANPSLTLALVLVAVLAIGVVLVEAQRSETPGVDDPWAAMPSRPAHVDHSSFFQTAFADGPSVTTACLKCHEESAHQVMQTSHWKWTGDHVERDGESIEIGKKNLINNFCIGIESNWPRCTSCHAGYGWTDHDFDFNDTSLVDCLVCHDTSGVYRKDPNGAGLPAPDVDLLAAARSVGIPNRTNCGSCHFNGGGGDAVKHGDMDGTMYYPVESIDVHMGRLDFACQDCHQTREHELPGRSMSVSVSNTNRIACTDCHASSPHDNARLDAHTSALACQTCHIPQMAVRAETKMAWDWSQAGEDRPGADPHLYSKGKGLFAYEQGVVPEYFWYNGTSTRHLKGDRMDPSQVTMMNAPLGDATDPSAKIWPFKVHRGRQIYDAELMHFLVPKTFGEDGYWEDFDWDQALRLGSEASGLEYSGTYDFAPTAMVWPLAHMVAPQRESLQCGDCHREGGRMDWTALGYDGDPARVGDRESSGLLRVRATDGGAR